MGLLSALPRLIANFAAMLTSSEATSSAGRVGDILDEYCSLPADEVASELVSMAAKFAIKRGSAESNPIYFKESAELKLLPSLAFDVANFVVMATSALVAASGEPSFPVESRFETRADAYLRRVAPAGCEFAPRELPGIPNVRFGAVLNYHSRLWLFSFVTGSNHSYFRRSVCETAINFKIAWASGLAGRIKHTVPLVNTETGGWEPDKIKTQLDELKTLAREPYVRWDGRDDVVRLFQEEED